MITYIWWNVRKFLAKTQLSSMYSVSKLQNRALGNITHLIALFNLFDVYRYLFITSSDYESKK